MHRGKVHVVMVFAPLLTTVQDVVHHEKYDMIPERAVRLVIFHTLIALDYLHRVCRLVHTGMFSFLDFRFNDAKEGLIILLT